MAEELRLEDVSVSFGAVRAVSQVSIDVEPNSRIGLIGPNGAGKTTLLNAISGFTALASGSIYLGGVELSGLPTQIRARHGVVRGFQTVRLLEAESVLTNILLGCERTTQPRLIEQICNTKRQRSAYARDRAASCAIAERLGLAGLLDQRVEELPFASRRLTEIARVMVSMPSLVLLDEPAAGLDHKERVDLTAVLRELHQEHDFTLIFVEHDVDVVRRLCNYVVAMDSGKVLATGTAEEVLMDPAVREAYFGDSGHA